ncbi:PAS domain S-box-containing protein [Syntrophus gentianae]|uniref:histidine kinase n=1 Tax=Syntrophus gentianae TaxID=43775 RepID=A0A1H7YR63_9BACT|nr:PAS domain S-box protein [Syntrophus gentianae]SEM47679.1 PAS domain S-box-containing protein [Syntrophus gentianae]
MKDEDKSKAQLVHELEALRRRIAKFESVEGHCKPAESLAEWDTLRNSLQVVEGKYRGIFENAIEGIYRSTFDGRLIEINPSFARLLGYDSPEAVKNSVKDIGQKFYVDPEKRKEWINQLAERDYGSFEVQLRRKDGSTRWISNKARVVRNEKGETLYFDGFVEDITEKRRAEEELKKAEEKYRSIFENALEGIYRTTPDGHFLDANPALARIFGYDSPQEMMTAVTNLGKQLHVSPESRERFISIMDQKDYDDFEAQMRKKDGSTCWVCFRGRSVRDAEGKTLYYEGLAEDITERRRTEEVLRQYRDHLEELVKERTFQLEERNRQLNSEIAERKKAEEALRRSERELRIKARNLMEVNTTLKVLLNTMERDQQELQERFLGNIKSQVLPYLEKLKKRPLQEVEKGFLQMAETNLNEIASPLVQKLKSSYLNLTKTEIQIAVLVKEGKTSKEIAQLLNAKQRVIEFHRQNIRKKLGMNDKRGSLALSLRSFS